MSSPLSRIMNPYPFAALNHFTVPISLNALASFYLITEWICVVRIGVKAESTCGQTSEPVTSLYSYFHYLLKTRSSYTETVQLSTGGSKK
jgi:hypothetical protein